MFDVFLTWSFWAGAMIGSGLIYFLKLADYWYAYFASAPARISFIFIAMLSILINFAFSFISDASFPLTVLGFWVITVVLDDFGIIKGKIDYGFLKKKK